MKKAFVLKEGVDLTGKKLFGDAAPVVHESQFLIVLRHWNESETEFILNYRFYDGYTQLIKIEEDVPAAIVAQYRYNGVDIKEKVACTLINYLFVYGNTREYPGYIDSVAFTESEYEFYVRKIIVDKAAYKTNTVTHLVPLRIRFDPTRISKN